MADTAAPETSQLHTQPLSVQPSRDDTLAEKRSDEKKRHSNGSAIVVDAEKSASVVHDNAADPAVDESRYLSGWKLAFMFCGLLFSIFLVALDQTIVATALPVIASKFNALNDLTWIVSGYFLQAGLMLTWGQIMTIAPTKWVYLFCIAVFEIGSLFCAVAWNVKFLIFGRAVAGVGAAGIFVSILVIIAEVTRLEQRPALFGAFGAVFAVASIAGPLLGGAFTDHVSWRWCFYINLPFGAISIAAICFLLTARPPLTPPQHEGKTAMQRWIGVDWLGTVLALGMITPLLLALQWGGLLYEWNDRVIIALLATFAAVLPLFVAWQWKMKGNALMPLHLFKNRTQVGAAGAAFFVMFNMILATYYLPFYYQAKGDSATTSGLKILPFMLSCIIAAGMSGAVINFTGRYYPFLVGGPLIGAVGAGLLFTIEMDISNAKLIGYQILFGSGVGFAMQNTIIAIQTEYSDNEPMIPQATAVVNFFQLVGGILGIAIAGTVFGNKLGGNIAIYAPGLDHQVAKAVQHSITVIFTLPVEMQPPIIAAYVASLKWVFIIGVPTCVVGSIFGAIVVNHNVKERGTKGGMHMA